MNKRLFQRVLACLLALLLLPLPTVFAEEAGTELTVTCRDIFREGEEKTVSVLETEDGYYITFDDAIRMVGLIHVGGDYFAPNAHVSLRPNTDGLEYITRNGEKWYALEQIMTELDTAILAADGEILYNSLPINQDRLMKEAERIMENGGYDADLLSNMPLLGIGTAGFAFAFDVVWNQRFDMLTGEGYEDDISALLLEMLKHHGDNDSLLTILANGTAFTEKVSGFVLKAQKEYETFYRDREEVVPGGGYLLFGAEGSGPLRETMEAVGELGNAGIKISDLISATAYVHEIKSVQSIYADALARVLEAPEIKYDDSAIVRQGNQIVRIYEDHMTDSRGRLVAEGILTTAEDIAHAIGENVVSGALNGVGIAMSPAGHVTKFLLEVTDSCTLKTLKKNDCVRNITMCAQIQDLFREAYEGSVTTAADTSAALTMRDAAMLCLKSAWVAYDSGSFDDSIAGAIKRVQGQIDEELILLAGFSDGMFCVEPNEPLPVGILSFHGEKDVPTGNEGLHHDLYFRFLREEGYIPFVKDEYLREELAVGYGGGEFYFYDADRDGIDDLIVWTGCSTANGEVQLFSGDGSEVVYSGSIRCNGVSLGVYGNDRKTGLILENRERADAIYWTSCDVVGGMLCPPEKEQEISLDGWYLLEPVGRVPLEADTGDEWGDAFELTALDGLFAMTVPGSWGPNVVVKDEDQGFIVYEKRNYEAGFGGELFHVYMSEYVREEDIDEPHYQVLGYWAEGFMLLAGFPICAQFDLNDVQMQNAYSDMEADIPGVLDSIRMTR